MTITAVIATLLIGPPQLAPPDVPKNHWAYPAVDRMFQEGLLKGYPKRSPAKLTLEKSLKLSLREAIDLKNHWKSIGFLVGYPEGMHVNTEGRYELAVAFHATWANATREDITLEHLEVTLSEFPKLARAISGMNQELTRLGADTKAMINRMNEMLSKRNSLFLGG